VRGPQAENKQEAASVEVAVGMAGTAPMEPPGRNDKPQHVVGVLVVGDAGGHAEEGAARNMDSMRPGLLAMDHCHGGYTRDRRMTLAPSLVVAALLEVSRSHLQVVLVVRRLIADDDDTKPVLHRVENMVGRRMDDNLAAP